MKKWKIIRNISLIIIIILILFTAIISYIDIASTTAYPHPAMGIDINNKLEDFILSLMLHGSLVLLPLLIAIVINLISLFKIKRKS